MMKNKNACEHCGYPTLNTPDNAAAYGVYERICESCQGKCDSEMNVSLSCYSDLFKDVYGFRPRGTMPDSLQEIEEEMNGLQQMLNEQQEDEGAQAMLDSDYINTFYEEDK